MYICSIVIFHSEGYKRELTKQPAASHEDKDPPLLEFMVVRGYLRVTAAPGTSINIEGGSLAEETTEAHVLQEYLSHCRKRMRNESHISQNIHSLYRLVVRAVQFLSLVQLLRHFQNITEFNEVDWGFLHGLTTSQLVNNEDDSHHKCKETPR